MADPDYMKIIDHIGSKPVQFIVGENPDGDVRYRMDVTYTYQNEERRRVWLSRRHLEEIHALLGHYLYPGGSRDASDMEDAFGNSDELPF